MGNSTVKLQDVIDYARTIGDLDPVLSAGGYSNVKALGIANDVMTEMIAQRFNFKFNRIVVPPFLTNSWQQDYATVGLKTIGWLEHVCAIDINNTATPKPLFWGECVRDLERTALQRSVPEKVCWLPNDQLTQSVWPGANKVITNPLGAAVTPSNPVINILDANGNILVLTTYGITGGVAPAAAALSPGGTIVNDGTCVWTVADPKAQGFRISPLPPQAGPTYQVNIIAQARPPRFTTVAQVLDPIPDDYAKYFQDGFIAYCHRHSPAPMVRARFDDMRLQWLQSLADAVKSGDRERDDARFVVERPVMSPAVGGTSTSPAWPFGPGQ